MNTETNNWEEKLNSLFPNRLGTYNDSAKAFQDVHLQLKSFIGEQIKLAEQRGRLTGYNNAIDDAYISLPEEKDYNVPDEWGSMSFGTNQKKTGWNQALEKVKESLLNLKKK